MKRFFVLFVIVFFYQAIVFAQSVDTIEKKIIYVDRDFVELLQLLRPDFHYVEDSAQFMTSLDKFVLDNMLAENKIFKDSLTVDSVLLRKRDLFLMLAESLYWAYIVEQNKSDLYVSDEACLSYYSRHENEFVEPYVFDYWQVWIYDTAKTSNALQKLEEFASAMESTEEKHKKYADSAFRLNFEYDRQTFTTKEFYQTLINTPLGTVSDPILVNSKIVYIIPIRKQGGEILPFSSVKEQCRQMIIAEKRKLELKKDSIAKSELYRIVVSDDL